MAASELKERVCPTASATVALTLAIGVGLHGGEPAAAQASTGQLTVEVRTSEARGLGREVGVCRRDPSDVVRLGRCWLVFYTRVEAAGDHPLARGGWPRYPSGYLGTIWYASSTDEGRSWIERGEALGRGATGRFDAFGVFTPNVLATAGGELLLYYTGVGEGFDNRPDDYAERNRTAIGVARLRLDEDGGLLESARPGSGRALLEPSPAESGRFDSFRVDDAALAVRDGRVWLYYKGRAYQGTPGQTKMGVAVAQHPEGPFTKLGDGRPAQPEGHEVLVWEQDGGVVSLATGAGRGLWTSRDGVRFVELTEDLRGALRAPGLFRPELVEHGRGGAPRWGIHMGDYGGDPFLERFEIALRSGGEDAGPLPMGAPSLEPTGPRPKALILGLDGVHPDALVAARTPQLDALAARGAISLSATNCSTSGDSAPNWASLLTGVTPERHGVLGNEPGADALDDHPHLFVRLERRDPRIVTASLVKWAPINERLLPDGIADLELSSADGDAVPSDPIEGDAVIARAAADLLAGRGRFAGLDPDVVFVHLDQCDDAGHAHGYAADQAEYLAAIERVDALVGEMLAALRGRPGRGDGREDWLVLATTDHGGYGRAGEGTGHSITGDPARDAAVRRVWWILSGPAVSAGAGIGSPRIEDVAATVLQHMGLDPGRLGLDGRAIAERPR